MRLLGSSKKSEELGFDCDLERGEHRKSYLMWHDMGKTSWISILSHLSTFQRYSLSTLMAPCMRVRCMALHGGHGKWWDDRQGGGGEEFEE